MPMRPPRHQRPTGCPACQRRHVSRQVDQRPSAAARGYDYQWQIRRQYVLDRDPVCRICGTSPSEEVDHIIPRARGGSDRSENLQGLCKSCHSRKTASEDGGFGRAPTEQP